MISIIRASRSLMLQVCKIINSNLPLYEKLIQSKLTHLDYFVDEIWAAVNFPKREFYLVKRDEQYIGTASFQVLADFGYIGYFHIHKDFHRQGIGRLLLNFLVLRCKTENITKLRLFTHEKAVWAQQFYSVHGFRLIESDAKTIKSMNLGVLKPYYASHHILWERSLNLD